MTMNLPEVGQIVHAACSEGGPVAYRCTEVIHDAVGCWSYTLEPIEGWVTAETVDGITTIRGEVPVPATTDG